MTVLNEPVYVCVCGEGGESAGQCRCDKKVVWKRKCYTFTLQTDGPGRNKAVV